MKRNRLQYVLLYLKGMAMGAADVVPGVSGGTIAFISGIYEELINALRSLDHRAVKVLFKEGPVAAWSAINGNFLAVLVSGILTSIVLLSRVVKYLLENHPLPLWSFFFGLILMSALMIYREAKDRHFTHHVLLCIGAVIAVVITWIRPVEVEPNLWLYFASAALAICAMILPGISGSFILLLIGMYPHVINAISHLDFPVLIVFAAGCGIGLMAFSHVLSWLLRRWHDAMLLFMTGFLVGSLSMVWPWKQVVETYVDRHGVTKPLMQSNVWPWQYAEVNGSPDYLLLCLVMMVVGVLLMPLLQVWARRLQQSIA